jgi:hypothetical protein
MARNFYLVLNVWLSLVLSGIPAFVTCLLRPRRGLSQMGKQEQAIRNFKRTLEINPQNYEADACLNSAKNN